MSERPDSVDGASSSGEGGFVGRVGELTTLEAGLEAARAGRGRLFLLSGEPGIGKTRMAAQFAGRARQQSDRVLWGRCWDGPGAPAYWPWVQAIRSLFRTTDLDTLEALMGPGASDIAQMFPELHALFPELPPLPSRDADSARFQLFDATTTFLKNSAETQPIVLVLDDLHAADTPTLLFLRFVAGQLADSRIVIVCTYRDAELTPQHPLTELAAEIAREPTTQEVALTGFDEAEIAALVEVTTDVRPDPALVVKLSRDTTGNPLYLEEAVRLLATEGRLDSLSDAALLHVPVPSRISDVIGRRVDHVSERCKEALRLGSLLGPEFSFEVLRRLGEFSAEELLDLLDEAVDANLLVRTADSPASFGFSHDLVRETISESLTQAERVILHGKAATVLEDVYGQDADSHLAELAYHFFEAAPGGQADKAVEYARLAGARASASLAYEEAARLHGMALSALELQPGYAETLRVDILLDLGDAQTRAAEDTTAKETFLRAAGLSKRTGEATQLARAAFGYGGFFVWQRAGADREMVPLLQDALMMLGGADDQLRVRLLSRLACAMRDTADRDRSDALSLEAVKTARELGDPATLCYALEGRCAAVMWPENPEERLAVARELIEVAEESDQLERAVSGHLFEVVALCDLGLIAEARSGIDSVVRGAETLRQPNQLFVAQVMGTFIDLIQGHFAVAETEILAALDARYSARDEFSTTRSHYFLLRREQGRLGEIEDFVRTSVREYPWYPLHRAALVCLLAELGRRPEAQELLDEMAHDSFGILVRDNEWLLGMALTSDGCAQLGDGKTAAVLYEQLLPFAGRHAVGWAEGSVGAVDRYLGLLAATMRNHEAAVSHFEDAIRVNGNMGARPWTAHSQHDYAVVLNDRGAPGDEERASDLFAAALATAHALGMVALEAKVTAHSREVSPVIEPESGAGVRGVFRREGEYWSVALGDETFRLRDTKGLGYLAILLSQPGREVHVMDLVGVDGGNAVHASEPDLGGDAWGAADDVLDPAARAAYRTRLKELSAEVDEATDWNDPERVARARDEMEFLTRELSGAVGLGGRSRKSGSAAERARVNVTRAIRTAMARVAENGPELGSHLDTTVRTGTFCSYMPDPRVPIGWEL